MNSVSPDDKTLIALGLIVKPRGLSGEVLIRAYNESNPNIKENLPVVISVKDKSIDATVESARWYGNRFGVKFKNISGRDQADNIKGGEIFTEMKNLPETKPGEFFVFELIGLLVVEKDDVIFGKIIDVMSLPANDVLIVEHEGENALIPMIKEAIDDIDIAAGRVMVSRAKEFLT